MRLRVIPQAAAKSHRPEKLFSEDTCPIVGAGSLGELFIKATTVGLDRLKELIEDNDSTQLVKEISSIQSIEAVTPDYRRRGVSPKAILQRAARGESGFVSRVRLFDLGSEEQERLVSQFKTACKQLGIHPDNRGYSPESYVYAVELANVAEVEALSKLVSVRSVAGMPLIKSVRSNMFRTQPKPKLSSRTEVKGDVPVVVVVDTGISEAVPELASWVVGRSSQVAPPYRNTEHGTFVAGLICHGSELNPTINGIDPSPCAVYDLQLVPNDDPKAGDTDTLSEQEFLISLEAALKAHANEYRVWNLSLGSDEQCSLDLFSEFAEELDNLQERYQVTFVISAGNYLNPPLLNYPRTTTQLGPGRITTPADSVLGLAVGAVSHVDYKHKGTKLNEPSAFSRHGAGPNHIIKPDLVHFGGACSTDGTHVSGIRSIHNKGTAENIGTSFAAPLVARTLAQIYHQITPAPSPVLARALLVHHARDPRTGARVPDQEENFFGFGLPASVPHCLECTPYSSTLVFDDILRPGFFLDWDQFPYPSSLYRNGRYFGQIAMTVAFAPSRGSRWGSEYCQTHIDAHFGVYREVTSRKTGEIKSKFVGLVPPEHRNPGQLYESYQVEKLRKWAPVRTYFGDMGKNGERGTRWRLKVQLLTRHGVERNNQFEAQPFSLIVTISDPKKHAPVYDQMAQSVRNRFQAQNLAVRATAQVRGRT